MLIGGVFRMSLYKLLTISMLAVLFATVHAAQQKVVRGYISKISVTNQDNTAPGFTVCVLDGFDPKLSEVCLWRKYNSYNYNQLLDTANMAIMANKPVEISANVLGALDSLTIFNAEPAGPALR